MTPALLLIHEFGHAYHHVNAPDPEKWVETALSNDNSLWTNEEDRKTITEIENVVAEQLNKSGAKEGKRFWHNRFDKGGPAVWMQMFTASSISIAL